MSLPKRYDPNLEVDSDPRLVMEEGIRLLKIIERKFYLEMKAFDMQNKKDQKEINKLYKELESLLRDDLKNANEM